MSLFTSEFLKFALNAFQLASSPLITKVFEFLKAEILNPVIAPPKIPIVPPIAAPVPEEVPVVYSYSPNNHPPSPVLVC